MPRELHISPQHSSSETCTNFHWATIKGITGTLQTQTPADM